MLKAYRIRGLRLSSSPKIVENEMEPPNPLRFEVKTHFRFLMSLCGGRGVRKPYRFRGFGLPASAEPKNNAVRPSELRGPQRVFDTFDDLREHPEAGKPYRLRGARVFGANSAPPQSTEEGRIQHQTRCLVIFPSPAPNFGSRIPYETRGLRIPRCFGQDRCRTQKEREGGLTFGRHSQSRTGRTIATGTILIWAPKGMIPKYQCSDTIIGSTAPHNFKRLFIHFDS